MKVLPFSGFEVGILDNPSNDAAGGFEFASGMDIFSEPGVMKANYALIAVSGFTPSALGYGFDTVLDGVTLRGYMAVGNKIYTSTDGVNWSLFITAGGTIYSLKIFNGYIFYGLFGALGRVQVNNAGTQNDAWQAFATGAFKHPQMIQGGTLKVGNGRYVMSINESFSATAQAMKAPTNYVLTTFANYQNRLMIGSTLGDFGSSNITSEDATTFDWYGTVLASGSALPDTSYSIFKRGMNLLLSTGQGLFAFPDRKGEIYVFNGAKFVPFRQLSLIADVSDLIIWPWSGCEHLDTVLFAGDSSYLPGIFQIKDGRITQSFTPGTPDTTVNFGFLASGFDGKVFVSYYTPSYGTYHVDYLTSNRQNGAYVKTVWHRARIGRRYPTDQFKRWGGVKLNLKPIPVGCSVSVAYRTDRSAAFVDSGYTITSSNQDKPVILPAQPRSREIQFQFTFTTSGANTPELMGYDILFEVLTNIRQ